MCNAGFLMTMINCPRVGCQRHHDKLCARSYSINTYMYACLSRDMRNPDKGFVTRLCS